MTGRLTRQLAEEFSVVHAIDVSPDMISMARQHILKDNVHFHLTNGLSIPLPDNSVTAAISIDVFQHFDTPTIAAKYFSEVYRILGQDGTFMVHLPIYLWPRISHPRLGRALDLILRMSYRLLRVADRIQAICKRRAIRLGYGQGFIYHLPYEGCWVFERLAELGFVDLEVHLFAHSGQGWHATPAVRPYVFGRKSLASSRRKLQFL
jgi:SAM-dependent methyltransferase